MISSVSWRFGLLLSINGFYISLQAQTQFATSTAEISIVSKAELELIKAKSNSVQGLIDIPSKKIAFRVAMSSFEGFNSSLQRKHFNENYMESEKFPVAKFSGKIIEDINLAEPGTYEVRVKGELEIHGQTQVRIIKGKITVRPNEVVLEAAFTVPLTDHNITIPKIVNKKIATEIAVDFKANLSPRP